MIENSNIIKCSKLLIPNIKSSFHCLIITLLILVIINTIAYIFIVKSINDIPKIDYDNNDSFYIEDG